MWYLYCNRISRASRPPAAAVVWHCRDSRRAPAERAQPTVCVSIPAVVVRVSRAFGSPLATTTKPCDAISVRNASKILRRRMLGTARCRGEEKEGAGEEGRELHV